jgi:hypothetical protein
VFEGPYNNEEGRSQKEIQGILAADLQEAFKPCKELESLRIADLVGDSSTYRSPANQNQDMYQENSPLGAILDLFVSNFKKLQELEVSGNLFTLNLFNTGNSNQHFELTSLSLGCHFHFPLDQFVLLLSSSRKLQKLQKLALDEKVKSDNSEAVWKALSKICHENKIHLRIQPGRPARNMDSKNLQLNW